MNHLFIHQLKLNTVIGVYPEEHAQPQALWLDIELDVETALSAQTDQLSDTVDYDKIAAQAHSLANQHTFQLIETFAHALADNMLQDRRIMAVRLKLTKFPKNLEAHSVGVVLEKKQAK